MTTIQDKEKAAVEGQGQGVAGTPSVESDESLTNPTGINEKALLRRLDLKLLPPLSLLYLLSFLDRSNGKSRKCLLFVDELIPLFIVGNAKLDGLTTDLNFTGNQYLMTLTIYFIGYVSSWVYIRGHEEERLI